AARLRPGGRQGRAGARGRARVPRAPPGRARGGRARRHGAARGARGGPREARGRERRARVGEGRGRGVARRALRRARRGGGPGRGASCRRRRGPRRGAPRAVRARARPERRARRGRAARAARRGPQRHAEPGRARDDHVRRPGPGGAARGLRPQRGAAGARRRVSGARPLGVDADGRSRGNPGPAGFGALVRDAASGRVLAERAAFLGTTTNNVAEYSGLVAGLRAAAEVDPDARVTVRMDSRLVVEQMSGRWQIKHDDMRRLAAEAAAVLPADRVTYEWVPRAQNAAADALANEAMDTAGTVARDYPDGPADDVPAEPAEQVASDAPGEATDGDAFDTPSRPSGVAVRFDDAPALTVVLVRHGQTPLTVAGAFSGSSVPGPSLTPRGRTQAAQAADLVFRIGRQAWPDVPRPTAIVSSPMVRAQET